MTLIGAFLLTLTLALACTLALDFIQMGGNASYLWRHSLTKALVLTLFGAAVIWLIVVLVLSLTGRLWLTVGVMFAATLVIGSINYQKLQLRQEPLYPSDWQMAENPGFLTQMVGWNAVVMMGVLVSLVLMISILVGRVLDHRFPRVTREAYPRTGV